MLKSKLRHALVLCLFIIFTTPILSQVKVNFTFQLSKDAATSAGVFSQTGVLVKTLWSGVFYKAGSYTQSWDGTDEAGLPVTGNNYQIRVLSNNIKYQWEGVVGNTSSALSGPTVHHAFQSMYGIVFAGTNGYYCTNYNEQQPPLFTFNTSNPQSKTSVLDKGGCTAFVTTDGNYVYWDGMDANDTARTYVYATRVSDNSEVTNFTKGVPVAVTYSRTYASAIDTAYNSHSKISGMAVQKKGNYLFVSHRNANQLHVLNKTTGALVSIVSITSPGGLAVDSANHLWVITGNKVSKYTVNTDGSLTAALTLSGLVAPLAVAVSTDGTTAVVADGGSSQQLKAFSNSIGSLSWTYGQAGGYATDPTVTDDKFYFADLTGGARTFIAFAPDGSFWVGDPGNCRTQHFSASRTLIDRIMLLPGFYSSVVDPNNSTRVFADYLEFSVDYSKTLSPSNGSWKLVKNWMYNVTAAYDDAYYRLRYLTTLSNGRTYAFLRHNGLAVVELPSTGGLRYTGIVLPSLNEELLKDGSLLLASDFSAGKPTKWTKTPLTGFDGSGNPVWGTPVVIATSPAATANDPLHLANTVLTSSNILVSFDAGLPPNGSGGYHLGGIKVGDTSWLWRSAPSTFKDYSGPYPPTGDFDIGNGVQNAGSYVRALDSTVIWGYHGEFWKGSQVNKWNHLYQDGLFLGQFGIALSSYPEADSLMSGNAFAVSFVKDTQGNGYVYLNDESYHSGIHRWKMTGLTTIAEQVIPVTKPVLNHGLSGQYFDSTDLNNFLLKTTRVDTVINLNGAPSNTGLTSTGNFSVRWSGFIQPKYSETYTIYAHTNKGMSLWINDTLLIDQWGNTANTDYSANVMMVAGNLYSVKMEYNNSATASASLSWSSIHQPKQIIPSANLYPASLPDTTGGIDLLDGLRSGSLLTNNLYGWKRNPAKEDSTNKYSQWWSVSSGYHTSDLTKPADVYTNFTQNSGVYTVTRDLGMNKKVDSWRLGGSVNYWGNAENEPTGKGGMYLEVLDDSARIIARFYSVSVYSADPVITLYANGTPVTSGVRSILEPVTYSSQPLNINADSGKITFTYGSFAPVTVKVFDSLSNWQNPQTMRLYFFGNGSNYGRTIDLEKMQFSKSQAVAVTQASVNTGLLGEYFDSTDLNNFLLKTTRVDTVVNLNGAPANTALPNTGNFSVRWSGFIEPKYSEMYTMYAHTNQGISLWINDTLLIDQWGNTANTDYSANVMMVAGKLYPVKMEYNNSTTASASLSWSSLHQSKQIIPSASLFPAALPDITGGIDLMEGLHSKSVLADNRYGWKRNPAKEDSTSKYNQWWSVSSGYHVKDSAQSADVSANFIQNSGIYTVTRDLGTNKSVNSWKLDGSVNYSGNNENESAGHGGMYVEVLDDLGKIIARFYSVYIYSADPLTTIYGNGLPVASAVRSILRPVTYLSQPLEINADSGRITFTYGPYAPVTANIFDNTGNWQNPKTLRLYFFGNGNNYCRTIDLEKMRFSKSGENSPSLVLAVTPEGISFTPTDGGSSGLVLYPNPVQNILQVRYPPVYKNGFLEIFAADGKKMKTLELPAGSNGTTSFDVTSLKSGTYFVRFQNESFSIVKRFIK